MLAPASASLFSSKQSMRGADWNPCEMRSWHFSYTAVLDLHDDKRAEFSSEGVSAPVQNALGRELFRWGTGRTSIPLTTSLYTMSYTIILDFSVDCLRDRPWIVSAFFMVTPSGRSAPLGLSSLFMWSNCFVFVWFPTITYDAPHSAAMSNPAWMAPRSMASLSM